MEDIHPGVFLFLPTLPSLVWLWGHSLLTGVCLPCGSTCKPSIRLRYLQSGGEDIDVGRPEVRFPSLFFVRLRVSVVRALRCPAVQSVAAGDISAGGYLIN